MNCDELQGRLALVTGAGSGIGRATALECARRGADVAICDIDDRGLEETSAMAQANGVSVTAARVDVSDAESMSRFAASVHERYEAVDLLVNNAGVGLVAGLLETTAADWDRLIGINLQGVVHGFDAFVPRMVTRGRGGHVVNVASQAGFHANPALGAYSATKYAVVGLSEATRAELRPYGIGVTAACPGIVNTAITRSSPIRGVAAAERQARLTRLYERRNYGPDRVAVGILRAVARDRPVAPITPEAHVAYVLTRVAPSAARWLAARMAAAAR